MKFINIGFGNMVSANRIVAIASPDSEPIKRLVRDAKEEGRVIDVYDLEKYASSTASVPSSPAGEGFERQKICRNSRNCKFG